MPSTTADFQKQIKKIATGVDLAIDTDSTDFSFTDKNFFSREITIDLTAKTARNIIAFQFDHLSELVNRYSTISFNDLRVFDVDTGLELPFYVESAFCTYCVIFVKFPSNITGVKKVRIEYGNSSKINKSDISVIFPTLASSQSLKYWVKANESNYLQQYIKYNTATATALTNHGDKDNILANELSGQARNATFLTGGSGLNGLPIYVFDGNKRARESLVSTPFGDEITTFIVVKASSQINYQSCLRIQNSGSNYILPCWYDSGSGVCTSSFSNDGGTTSSVNVGAVNNVWNILTMRRKRNTTNGHQAHRNSTLVGQRNSGNVTVGNAELWLGANYNDTEFFNGNIAETIVFNKYLSDSERLEVEKYLDIKYNIINPSDYPVFTVGSRIELAVGLTWQASDPFADYNTKAELEKKFYGIAETTAEANITTMLSKTLATGSPLENWANATNDITQKIGTFAKVVGAGTIGVSPRVRIDKIEASINRNDLSSYNVDIYRTATTTITSSNEDFIELSIWCSNVSLISTLSSVVFSSLDLSKTATATLVTNVNDLSNNEKNIVKIKKSSFAFTPSTTWSDVSFYATFNLFSTSGSVDILINNLKLTQNINDNPVFQVKNPANLINVVSSDNNITTVVQSTLRGRIENKKVNENGIAFDLSDILAIIKDKKFGDLPSFPKKTDFIYFHFATYIGSTQAYLTQLLIDIVLTQIMPQAFYTSVDFRWDTVAPTVPGGYTFATPNRNYYLCIHKTDKISDVITRLCATNYASLSWNNGLFALQASKQTTGNLAFTNKKIIKNSQILEFKNSYSETDTIYNKYIINEKDSRSADIQRGQSVIYSQDDNFELVAGDDTQLFYKVSEYRKKQNVRLLGNARVDGFLTALNNGSTSYDQTGIVIKSIYILDTDTIVVTVRNNNVSVRYMRLIHLVCDYQVDAEFLQTTENKIWNKNFVPLDTNIKLKDKKIVYELTDSINKYGDKPLILDELCYIHMFENATDIQVNLPQVTKDNLLTLSKPKNFWDLKIVYQPLYVGDTVQFNNQDGRKILGFITKVENYSSDEGQSMNLRIRQTN